MGGVHRRRRPRPGPARRTAPAAARARSIPPWSRRARPRRASAACRRAGWCSAPRRTTPRRCTSGAGPTGCRSCRRPPSGWSACSRARPAIPTTSWCSRRRTSWSAPSRRSRSTRSWRAVGPSTCPVVLAALEAACTDEFNMHGLLATTWFSGPVVVVNGPITRAIGMNNGINALGPGNRANATIGRALQLVIRNVGGGRPGEVDRATIGQPGKFTCCFAEHEDAAVGADARRARLPRRPEHRHALRGRGRPGRGRPALPHARSRSPARSPVACAPPRTRSSRWRSTRWS